MTDKPDLPSPTYYIGEAERFANQGLDDPAGAGHEIRSRRIAYAQVMATCAIARALDKIATRGIEVDTHG